jgi:hypothetical protein
LILPHPTSLQEVAQDAISLSQESVLSEVSAGGTHRKRARKCSVVRDPIHLADLQALARRNRQVRTAGDQ